MHIWRQNSTKWKKWNQRREQQKWWIWQLRDWSCCRVKEWFDKTLNRWFASLQEKLTSQISFAQDAAEAVFFADSSSSSSSSDFQPIKFLSTDQHGKTQKIKQCCGQYPKRFPYVVGGNHECCKTGFMEVLKPIGTCWIF